MAFGGGTGTQQDPYLIYNMEHFNSIRDVASYSAGVYYKVMNDFSFSGAPWTVIPDFRGTIDGQGFTISDMNFAITTSNYITGIFRNLNGATIKNIKFTFLGSSQFSDTNYDGMIAGYAANSTFQNITITAAPQNDKKYFGGLVGQLGVSNTVDNITLDFNLTANGNYVGGLVGLISASGNVIKNITKKGFIRSTSDNVGGLIGRIYQSTGTNDTKLTNVTVTSDIEATQEVGGLIGSVASTMQDGLFSKLSFTGNVAATSGAYVGGIIGLANTFTNVDISEITVEGNIRGNTTYVGGFAGRLPSFLGNISDITINVPQMIGANSYIGGFVGDGNSWRPSTTVSRVVINTNILPNSNGSYLGGFAGTFNNPYDNITIDDFEFNGSIKTTGGQYHGGFAGYFGNDSTQPSGLFTVNNIRINADIESLYTSTNFTGGVFGWAYKQNLKLTNVVVNGTLLARGQQFGGLAGYFWSSALTMDSIKINMEITLDTINSAINTVGLVFGYFYGSSNVMMSNITTEGLITNSASTSNSVSNIGGLAGNVVGGFNLTNFKNHADITIKNISSNYVGGLGGELNNATYNIDEALNTGTITLQAGNYIGGLIGRYYSISTGYTRNLKNTGDVIAPNCSHVAGIFGYTILRNTTTGELRFIYNNARISGNTNVGGIIGYHDSGWFGIARELAVQGTIQGNNYVGGILGGTSGGSSYYAYVKLEDIYIEANIEAQQTTSSYVSAVVGRFSSYSQFTELRNAAINYTATGLGKANIYDISASSPNANFNVYINETGSTGNLKSSPPAGVSYLPNESMKDKDQMPGFDYSQYGPWGGAIGSSYVKLRFIVVTLDFDFISTKFPTISFKVNEIENELDTVEILLNGVPKATYTENATGVVINYNVNFSELQTGDNIIRIVATDISGYVIEEKIVINREAENKFSLQLVNSIYPNVTFQVNKTDGNVTSINVYLNGQVVKTFTPSTSVGKELVFTVNPVDLEFGDNALKVEAVSDGKTLAKNFALEKQGIEDFTGKSLVVDGRRYDVQDFEITTDSSKLTLDRVLEASVGTTDLIEVLQEDFVPYGAISNSVETPATLTKMSHHLTSYQNGKALDEYRLANGEGAYVHSKLVADRTLGLFNSKVYRPRQIFVYKEDLQ
jgi:hypothetical protein